MSHDISELLREWKYETQEVTVRMIDGDDGRPKVQLRLDLGILQMEVDGRPDGERPEGCESWLEYYVEKQRVHEATYADTLPFELTDVDCHRLWQEGVQYYHRYLSFWHLSRYALCARDTQRNLRLFTFTKQYARGQRNKWQFDQFRPYVTMMHARGVAMPLVEKGDYREALRVIDAGVEAIRDFLDEYRLSARGEECAELASLEQWRNEVRKAAEESLDSDAARTVAHLRLKLQEAVAEERFEEAAALRDQIRKLSPG